MIPVQGWLLLACACCAMSAEVGDAGLAALAAARAQVTAVSGTGTETIQRADQPDVRGDPHRIRFAVAAGGRYSIVRTDPADPEGERLVFGSDGAKAWEVSKISADDDHPVVKLRAASLDLLQRMLACLRLDLAALRQDYAVELKPAADGLRELRLVPTDPDLARDITAISVLLDDAGRPTLVVLDEASGNRRRVEITAFTDDPVLDPGLFTAPEAAKD